VLSVVFRRLRRAEPPPRVVKQFAALVEDDAPLGIPGIVLQELLSGVRTATQFAKLDEILDGFPLLLATRQTHISAARVRNQCRASGLAASTVDCLVAAHALVAGATLMTLDDDFRRMAPHVGLTLVPIS